jgi:acetolactate synthase-1/2/3 large subunit/N2-(2-carboxyethyl)arginine synthase
MLLLGYDYVEDLRPTMWGRGEPKKVIRLASVVNPTPGLIDPDIDVVCPLNDSMNALLTKLADAGPRVPHAVDGMRERVAHLRADSTEHTDGLRVHQVVERISRVLGDGILVSDIGFFRHFGVLFSRVSRPYGFITSAGCSTFGFGLPAAMGAQLTDADLPVVMIAGDGGFHSNSQDLETLVRLGLPVVMVVVNNDSNGLIRLYQSLGHGRDHGPAVDFGAVDYVKLASANGCDGRRTETIAELEVALEEAIAARRPCLIEVPIAYDLDQAGGYQALEI